MKVRLGFVSVLVLSAAGCWPQMGGNPGNTHFNDHEDQLTVDNVSSLSLDWGIEPIFNNFWRPVVWGDTLYTVRSTSECGPECTEYAVEARDPDTGAVRWDHPLPANRARGVVYIDDALWAPYNDTNAPACTSTLLRLDPDTGAVLSADQVPEVLSPIVGEGSWSPTSAGTAAATPGRWSCAGWTPGKWWARTPSPA